MNVFQYANKCESWWRAMMSDMTGYKPFTTFFSDLSIAEFYGIPSIKATYKSVIKSWGKNIKYMTEFSLCLNHKIWQLYENNENIAKIYDELWRECCEYIESHFEGEDLSYYYEVTD